MYSDSDSSGTFKIVFCNRSLEIRTYQKRSEGRVVDIEIIFLILLHSAKADMLIISGSLDSITDSSALHCEYLLMLDTQYYVVYTIEKWRWS